MEGLSLRRCYLLIAAFVVGVFISVEAVSARETDHTRLLPELSKDALFDYQNIYLGAEGRLGFPVGFTGDEKLTGFGGGFAGEIGYDWDGWLLAVRSGYQRYGEGFNDNYLMNIYRHIPLSFEASKLFGNNFLTFLPSWMDIRATIGLGFDFFYADYYKSLAAKEAGIKAEAVGSVQMYDVGLAAEYNKLPHHWIPYLAVNLDMANDRSGFLFMPSLALGIRKRLGKVEPKPVVEEPVVEPELSIALAPKDFTPNGDGKNDELTATIKSVYGSLYSEPDSWKIQIFDSSNNVVKTFTGTGAVPETITWDGKDDNGNIVKEEADYTAVLTVTSKATKDKDDIKAGDAKDITAQDTVRVGTLVEKPKEKKLIKPELAMNVAQKDFTPDGDGENDLLRIGVKSNYGSQYPEAESWKLEISSPSKKVFKTFTGTGSVPTTIEWDGKSDSGELVQSATDYPAKLTVVSKATEADGKKIKVGDKNTITADTKVRVGILVERTADGQLKILVPSISFDPDKATFEKIGEEAIAKNKEILDQITEILQKYGQYKISIEGHANNTTETEKEEINELIPLSLDRANAIKNELVSRGIEADRISTEGKGGRFPVSKLAGEGWKNRRVEFILKK